MIYQNILVPLDGSELAERVVPAALYMAAAMSGSLTLLTVVAKKPGSDMSLMAKAIQTGQFEANLYLQSVKKRLMPTMVPVKTAVITGKPDKDIIKYAQEAKIDLIIMSTHGRSGRTRWSFGRTAEKVLRRSPCPTIILRSDQTVEPDKFSRLLLPLDGSPLAERVLEPARSIVQLLGLEVFLLHVVEHGNFYGFGYSDETEEAEVALAKSYLAGVQAQQLPPDAVVQSHVAVGSAADMIVDYAKTQKIDLILVSSRGASGFDNWMFGGVAEKVMKGAPCAIMVMRQEPFEQPPK